MVETAWAASKAGCAEILFPLDSSCFLPLKILMLKSDVEKDLLRAAMELSPRRRMPIGK
jgi:hypothetical protein